MSGARRAVFLLLATGSGLLWYPVAQQVNATEVWPGVDHFIAPSLMWKWLLVTGALTGIGYLGIARRNPHPSLWWALAIPVLGLIARWITESYLVITGGPSLDPVAFFIAGLFVILLNVGWYVLPLTVPYLFMLRWMHGVLQSPRLSRRRVARHALWLAGGLALVGVTDGARFLRREGRQDFAALSRYLGVSLSPGTRYLGSSSAALQYSEHATYWFRSDSKFTWPIVYGARPLMEPEERLSIDSRAATMGILPGQILEYRQGKWFQEGKEMRGTLMRTHHGDYLEIIAVKERGWD